MNDSNSNWARQAFYTLICRAAEDGIHLEGAAAASVRANVDAMKALFGGSDTPEADVAALLRSDHPIEPEVREALARALEGIGPICLEATGQSYGKEGRRRRALKVDLDRGRRAIAAMPEVGGYDAGVKAIAGENGVSDKTIIRNVAFARRADAWIDAAFAAVNERERPIREWFEAVYLNAIHKSGDPDQRLETALAEWRARGVNRISLA